MATAVIVRAPAEVDAVSVPEFRRQLHAAVDEHPGAPVEVDLGDVEFIDSCGLGAFVSVEKRARERATSVVFTNVSDRAMKLFKLTGLDQALELRTAS